MCWHSLISRCELTTAHPQFQRKFPGKWCNQCFESRIAKSLESSHKNAYTDDTERYLLPAAPSYLSCFSTPCPPSPCSLRSWTLERREIFPPRPRVHPSLRDASEYLLAAACGSAQAGNPSLRASACALSRTHCPIITITQPPQRAIAYQSRTNHTRQ